MPRITNHVVKLMIFTILVIVNTTWVSAQTWAKTTKYGKKHTTTLQFYFHDTVTGKVPTAVQVAQPTNPSQYKTGFGKITMVDDPLTFGPDPNSKLVGRAQGLYGQACQDEVSLIMALSYSFVDGPYKGSSLSIMGRNQVMHAEREMSIVGGTGLFRMARGYALAHTYMFDIKKSNAIVGYNVTVIH
ncbi:dirigent protein 23-like [Silene latifolia]|uniref:dirigent protein 23-like n=1 Tax=Silene latifolia TaxID=37657 RepID=UPI003D783936